MSAPQYLIRIVYQPNGNTFAGAQVDSQSEVDILKSGSFDCSQALLEDFYINWAQTAGGAGDLPEGIDHLELGFNGGIVEIPRSALLSIQNLYVWQNLGHPDSCLQSISLKLNSQPIEPPCSENSDCPDGQKCVNGECVDCEEEQADYFRFRVEFDRETAVPDLGGNVSKIDIAPRSIASMNSSTVIETSSYSNLSCLVRAIPCDASGNPKPYNGNASFKCNAQSNTNQGLIEYSSGVESGWKHTGMINSSADGITGYQYTRIEVNGIEESAAVYEEGCGGYVAEEPEQIPVTGEPPIIPPPVEPEEPEVLPPPSEPSPPDDWPQPWEPPYTPPINPIPPTQPLSPEEPTTGCDCEIYLAQYIGSRLVWLVTAVLNVKDTLYNFTLSAYDIINALIQFLSSVYSNFSLFLVEFLRLIYQTALHFVTVYQNEQFKNREKIAEVVDELKTFNTKFAEFADNYEPVQIENEYRTQSHRIIDNLDSTLNKL